MATASQWPDVLVLGSGFLLAVIGQAWRGTGGSGVLDAWMLWAEQGLGPQPVSLRLGAAQRPVGNPSPPCWPAGHPECFLEEE